MSPASFTQMTFLSTKATRTTQKVWILDREHPAQGGAATGSPPGPPAALGRASPRCALPRPTDISLRQSEAARHPRTRRRPGWAGRPEERGHAGPSGRWCGRGSPPGLRPPPLPRPRPRVPPLSPLASAPRPARVSAPSSRSGRSADGVPQGPSLTESRMN